MEDFIATHLDAVQRGGSTLKAATDPPGAKRAQ
jgi:hypothetical protein